MFDKLDAYNLVANLVPGAALTYALNFSGFPAPDPNDIGAFLLVAFVAGVMTNRLGSLLLDPLLRHKKVKFLHPKDYRAFVASERSDPKLETIVANAGLYRTFVTAGILYILLLWANRVINYLNMPSDLILMAFVVAGIFVSVFSLKKEDEYIHERLNSKVGD